MNELFSVRNVTWTAFEDGFDIVVTTDVPCHLWMRHTLEKPRIHAKGAGGFTADAPALPTGAPAWRYVVLPLYS